MAQEEVSKEEAIFLSLVYSFHAAAMQQMGKIVHPFTGKVERDLDAARGTIDVIRTLDAKTRGNQTERERRILNQLLTELQLNFADECNKPAPPEEKGGPAAEETPQETDKV